MLDVVSAWTRISHAAVAALAHSRTPIPPPPPPLKKSSCSSAQRPGSEWGLELCRRVATTQMSEPSRDPARASSSGADPRASSSGVAGGSASQRRGLSKIFHNPLRKQDSAGTPPSPPAPKAKAAPAATATPAEPKALSMSVMEMSPPPFAPEPKLSASLSDERPPTMVWARNRGTTESSAVTADGAVDGAQPTPLGSSTSVPALRRSTSSGPLSPHRILHSARSDTLRSSPRPDPDSPTSSERSLSASTEAAPTASGTDDAPVELPAVAAVLAAPTAPPAAITAASRASDESAGRASSGESRSNSSLEGTTGASGGGAATPAAVVADAVETSSTAVTAASLPSMSLPQPRSRSPIRAPPALGSTTPSPSQSFSPRAAPSIPLLPPPVSPRAQLTPPAALAVDSPAASALGAAGVVAGAGGAVADPLSTLPSPRRVAAVARTRQAVLQPAVSAQEIAQCASSQAQRQQQQSADSGPAEATAPAAGVPGVAALLKSPELLASISLSDAPSIEVVALRTYQLLLHQARTLITDESAAVQAESARATSLQQELDLLIKARDEAKARNETRAGELAALRKKALDAQKMLTAVQNFAGSNADESAHRIKNKRLREAVAQLTESEERNARLRDELKAAELAEREALTLLHGTEQAVLTTQAESRVVAGEQLRQRHELLGHRAALVDVGLQCTQLMPKGLDADVHLTQQLQQQLLVLQNRAATDQALLQRPARIGAAVVDMVRVLAAGAKSAARAVPTGAELDASFSTEAAPPLASPQPNPAAASAAGAASSDPIVGDGDPTSARRQGSRIGLSSSGGGGGPTSQTSVVAGEGEYGSPARQSLCTQFLRMLLLDSQHTFALTLLSHVGGSDVDRLVRAYVNLYQRAGAPVISLLKLCIVHEVQTTPTASVLFRSNSAATKMWTAYASSLGRKYHQRVLTKAVNTVLASSDAVELDPNKIKGLSAEQVAQRVENLTALSKQLLEDILSGARLVPWEFRHMFNFTHTLVAVRFDEEAAVSGVGSFLFLRCLVPAIATPSVHGLCADSALSAEHRRTFILLSKVIQGLAVAADSFKKETYMMPLDPFVKANRPRVRRFFRDLAFYSNADPTLVQQPPTIQPAELFDSFVAIHRQCHLSHPKLLTLCTGPAPPGPALKELGAAELLRQLDAAQKVKISVVKARNLGQGGGECWCVVKLGSLSRKSPSAKVDSAGACTFGFDVDFDLLESNATTAALQIELNVHRKKEDQLLGTCQIQRENLFAASSQLILVSSAADSALAKAGKAPLVNVTVYDPEIAAK
jgi:hypothetical protein